MIILDGAADLPIAELGAEGDGATPLEAAETPNLDALALAGRVGRIRTTPPGFETNSDVCCMSLLGYDPARFHTGRAPIEAAALGIETAPGDWLFRLNLVTVGEEGTPNAGLMLDHSGGGLSSAEGAALAGDLLAYWQREAPDLVERITVRPAVDYRAIFHDASGRSYRGVDTVPPHAIPGEAWEDHLPDGVGDEESKRAADALCALMGLSHEFLSEHEINRTRREQGLRPANMAWIWGGGTMPTLEPFERRFGLRATVTSAVDLLKGLARLTGIEIGQVPGLSGYHDNDYAGQGRWAVDALDRYDLVIVHVEAPDEASHQADFATKVAAIEAIDREIVGPVLAKLRTFGDAETDAHAEGWRILCLPDHYTLCSTRKHDGTPVPFAMAGAWVRAVVQRRFTEAEAEASDLQVDEGHELMEFFLRSGLAQVRVR